MPKRFVSADPAATVATLLLLLALGWKMVLLGLSTEPARATALSAHRDSSRDRSPTRVILLPSAADTVAIATLRATLQPGGSLQEHRLWTGAAAPSRIRERAGALRRLAESYGYPDVPILVTLDEEGHVVRVRSVAGRVSSQPGQRPNATPTM